VPFGDTDPALQGTIPPLTRRINSLARLRTNVMALGLIQIANLTIPLFTLPYLTRVLGVEAYGKVALVQAITTYLILFVDFGFSWSATRTIAACRDDRELVSTTFWENWTAQWLLFCVATVALFVMVAAIPRFHAEIGLFSAGLAQVLATVLFPVWLLQGLEKLREAAICQLAGRLLALPLIFVLVKSPQDAAFSLLLTGLGPVLAGLFALAWMWRRRLIGFALPKWPQMFGALRSSAHLFGSKLSVSAYTTLNPIMLESAAGTIALGYFNLADKACSAAQCVLNPFSQAIFPRMANLYEHNPAQARKLLRLSILIILALAGAMGVGLWLVSDLAIHLLGGEKFQASAQVLRWLALLPIIKGLSNIFGVQIMIPNGMHATMNRILAGAGILSVAMIWPMSLYFGAVGAAQTSLITESFVMIMMGICVYRKGFLSRLG
jgi:O-antigen/teichoic acid export membrane protein